MDQILSKLYYDAAHPASFGSAPTLYRYAKTIDPSITLDIVKEWLAGEVTYTLHKQVRNRFPRRKILVSYIDQQWQIDLTFMPGMSRQNRGYNHILTAIDCFSRYGFARPLKTKRPSEVIAALKDIFETERRKPAGIQSDRGLEFTGRVFKDYMKEQGIHFFTSKNVHKCPQIERFNLTLKTHQHKDFTASGSRDWVSRLQDHVRSYNLRPHRSIGMAPADVSHENSLSVFRRVYGASDVREYLRKTSIRGNKIKAGDTVRHRHKLTRFDRIYYPLWEDVTHTVQGVTKVDQPLYRTTYDPSQRFYLEQVQKVKPSVWRVERILQTRTINGQRHHLVKWLGYPSTANQWIPATDLVSMPRAGTSR